MGETLNSILIGINPVLPLQPMSTYNAYVLMMAPWLGAKHRVLNVDQQWSRLIVRWSNDGRRHCIDSAWSPWPLVERRLTIIQCDGLVVSLLGCDPVKCRRMPYRIH